jgi:amino acid transporter
MRLAAIGVIIAVLTAINIVGVKTAIRTLNLVTILKVGPLVAFVVWGLWAFAQAIPAPQLPAALGDVNAITLLLLYAFVGFESATATAGETSNTKRNLPRALIATMIAMSALYFLIQLAYVAVMQGRTPEGAPLAAAAQVLAGPWGAVAIAAIAMASITGNSFGSFLSTPRITFAMAEEGSLPRWFGSVHRRFATPANSILALGLFATVLAMSSAFIWLAIIASLTRMLVYLVCTAALLRVRAKAPKQPRPFGALLLRAVTPVVAAAFCVFAITQAEEDAWLFLGAFAAAGAVIYALSRWTRRAESQNG